MIKYFQTSFFYTDGFLFHLRENVTNSRRNHFVPVFGLYAIFSLAQVHCKRKCRFSSTAQSLSVEIFRKKVATIPIHKNLQVSSALPLYLETWLQRDYRFSFNEGIAKEVPYRNIGKIYFHLDVLKYVVRSISCFWSLFLALVSNRVSSIKRSI